MLDNIDSQDDWQLLSPEEKKRRLFLKQKAMLESFLERGAISQAQYDKSYNDMVVKMNIQKEGGK